MGTSARITESFDAVIVGARCAGAATALLLARQGLRVLAIDRGAYGSDTLSTHALMRPAVHLLARWGLVDRLAAAGAAVIESATFHYGDEAIAVPIKPREGMPGLLAPRRTLLDRTLVDAARAAGADVRHGVRFEGVVPSLTGRVAGITMHDATGRGFTVRAPLVIGADGWRSQVARAVGAERYREGRHATAVVYGHFADVLSGEPPGYHWHYRPGVSAGVIPSNGCTCVFVAMPRARFANEVRHDLDAGFRRVLAEAAPAVADSLAGMAPVARLRGFAGAVGFFRRSFGPGFALVGDAGAFRDPITAHGITDALRDAQLLAHAVARGHEAALAAYQHARDRLALPYFEVTDAIAGLDWDYPQLKSQHRRLSELMGDELRVLERLEAGLSLAA